MIVLLQQTLSIVGNQRAYLHSKTLVALKDRIITV
jgi:hypothetical protein